jgi:CheY-like chemotaxis protein
MGHAVVFANGKEELAALEKQPFDLILTQVRMRDMDGCDFAAAIRRNEWGKEHIVPIVGMTTNAECQKR